MSLVDSLMRIPSKVRFAFRSFVLRDREALAVLRWRRDMGDATLRLDYPLDRDSIVIDVGGYQGDWAQQIFARYGCWIYVFEPVHAYAERIKNRFAGNDRISVFDFGLSDRDRFERIVLCDDGSSTHRSGSQGEQIQLRDVVKVFEELGIKDVALMKINVEGEEFRLLPRMIESGIVTRCRDLQIQFHSFVDGAAMRREQCRMELARTHDLTYDYEFVWENWRRKDGRNT